MKPRPKITDTEWEIMRIIWQRHPISAADILAQLTAEDPTWHPKTARTLLNRLVQKKALSYEAEGRTYYYTPLVSEKESVADESESFLDRVFRGSLTPLIAHFVEQRRLKPEDLAELRGWLATADREEPSKGRRKK
jgi:BlaI family transcriptional regulator, penicillinase repressor